MFWWGGIPYTRCCSSCANIAPADSARRRFLIASKAGFAIGNQGFTIGNPWLATCNRILVIGDQGSAIGNPGLAICNSGLAIGNPRLAIGNQQSRIGTRQSRMGTRQSRIGNRQCPAASILSGIIRRLTSHHGGRLAWACCQPTCLSSNKF